MKKGKLGLPSAKDLFQKAVNRYPTVDINELHSATYVVMKEYVSQYYHRRVDEFLSQLKLNKKSPDKSTGRSSQTHCGR